MPPPDPGMSSDDLKTEVSAVKAAASWPDERQRHGDAAIEEVVKLKTRWLNQMNQVPDQWVLQGFVKIITKRLEETTNFSDRLISFAVNAVFGDPPRARRPARRVPVARCAPPA